MMTTVWEELRGNDCDQLLEKSTTIISDGSVQFIEFPIQSSPEEKKMPSVEEEMGGNNSGHSSDKSTTSSEKSTITTVSDKSSDSPDSSPTIKRPRLADQPGIDDGGIGDLSVEDDRNVMDDRPDSETETKTKSRVDFVLSEYRQYAELALAHYKEDKGLDYEYTGVRFVAPLPLPSGCWGSHLNFYARLSGSGSKEMAHFYAELDHYENKVYNCCILPGEHDSKARTILHPQGVQCELCEYGDLHGVDPFLADTDDECTEDEQLQLPYFV